MTPKNEDEMVITATVEDYLERILLLSEDDGHAHVTEIANLLGISKASVTEMTAKLKSNGFVEYEKYGTISLTEKGRKIAVKVKERHDILKSFLVLIGVNDENASNDCCVMEHNLSKETIDKLKVFIEFLQEKKQEDVFERLSEYIS
ncbi:MAG: helix-turn-helix domain-containing protein [Candidatus Heimdallarchaeota archaeon]|nr:helix-turn-helix domain-containing protein [Candidatus Heimdallarchaeota archaeon]MCK5158737.1 helix-turn-helix domain-containing protein [Candidatus Heimdallarchaeota archaeon]MCK5185190.1 helix-turn-helix domain-containing protein [Candidatus Heimdallarchaeota archaeon]MCK5299193.1 helix-turn-helix domain-containing protein [Candidatus Heimdallarchaeota archaeon]